MDATDEDLAFLFQLQEIERSTSFPHQEFAAGAGSEKGQPQQLRTWNSRTWNTKGTDGDRVLDVHNDAAVNLAVDELGSFQIDDEDKETQLVLLELARLDHLDAIQEQDERFARSLACMPEYNDWDRTGLSINNRFTAPSSTPPDRITNEKEEYDSVLNLFMEETYNLVEMRSHIGEKLATHVQTPLIIRETSPSRGGRSIIDTKQQGKGKTLMHEEGYAATTRLPSIAGSRHDHGRFGTDTNAGEDGQKCCQICFEAMPATSTFVTLEGCGHKFCATCVTRHAKARILDGGQMHVTCLNDECSTIIPDSQLLSLPDSSKFLDVLTRRQVEAAIPETERMYCPFADCSALLIKPSSYIHKPSSSTHPHTTAVGYVECEVCHRAFCLECKVAWHANMSCAEYKADSRNLRLGGDEKLLQLADSEKWQRCTKCGQVVDKITGCYHMKCRCNYEFCYNCGAPWPGGGRGCPCSESRLLNAA